MSLGLVSSSFGNKTADEILDILNALKLDYIEWCSCHVPHGDENTAKKVAELTKSKNKKTLQYNSSFEICGTNDTEKEFEAVLKTAELLGTDTICLKAGKITFKDADKSYIAKFISELETIAKMAKDAQKCIVFEYIENTLFDNYTTTLNLLFELDYDNVYINWQPNVNVSLLYSIFELKTLIKFIKNVHISSIDYEGEYVSLIESRDDWRQYANILKNKERFFFFKHFGNFNELKSDVNTMREILKSL